MARAIKVSAKPEMRRSTLNTKEKGKGGGEKGTNQCRVLKGASEKKKGSGGRGCVHRVKQRGLARKRGGEKLGAETKLQKARCVC